MTILFISQKEIISNPGRGKGTKPILSPKITYLVAMNFHCSMEYTPYTHDVANDIIYIVETFPGLLTANPIVDVVDVDEDFCHWGRSRDC